MDDLKLTQDDINRMLNEESINNDKQKASDNEAGLTALEIDTLGEVGNISMGAAATALYSILGRKVLITTPKVTITNYRKLTENHIAPYFVVNVEYTEGFLGNNLFILQIEDVRIITDIMMGGDGSNINDDEMDEIHISAISEAMNQLMGAMSTSMATMFNRVVNISPPKSEIVQLTDYEIKGIVTEDTNNLVRISFVLQIDGLVDSSIMQLVPLHFARQLLGELLGSSGLETAEVTATTKKTTTTTKTATTATTAAKSPENTISNDNRNMKNNSIPNENIFDNNESYNIPNTSRRHEERTNSGYDNTPNSRTVVGARPIQLTSFDNPEIGFEKSINELGIDMILDVPLQVKVELGQCKKTIKEILELNIGSIISLDKLAGETVDLVVNGKAIAKGEVIVIEDNYGIRITEILSPGYRIRR